MALDKRPTLTIKKPLSLEKQAQMFMNKAKTKPASHLKKVRPSQKPPQKSSQLSFKEKAELRRQRQQKEQISLKWLMSTFPLCFNLQTPRPLKIDILKDIFAYLEALPTGEESPSRLSLRKAVFYYTSKRAYHQAVLTSAHRINLKGEEEGNISPEHQQHAQDEINLKDQRIKIWQEKKQKRPSSLEHKKIDHESSHPSPSG